jgi:hypothetical protein
MGRGTSDILCHPGDIFRHHQNPSLGGSGSARPPRKALARLWHFPLWPPPLARPHKWASAFDQHIFTDARSASLRKLGLWLVSELSPLGKMGLGWRPLGGSGSARPPRKALGSTAAFRLWQPPLAQPHRMVILCTTAIQGPTAFIDALPSATYPCSIYCG